MQQLSENSNSVWKPPIDTYQSPNLVTALNCPHLSNGESSVNKSVATNSLNIGTISNSLLNGMKKQSSLDLNNNNSASVKLNSNLNKNKTTTSNLNQQLKFQNKPNLYTSSPPSLISTIQETESTDLIRPTSIYPRPPILKHQTKNNSLSSNSTSSSSAITNSSFDSNLSIDNLPSFYRTDSHEKLICNKILSDRFQSQPKFNKPHGKIPKLSGNFIEQKINTPNLIHKSIVQRSQSEDEMNYNVKGSLNKPNSRTSSTTNVSNVTDKIYDQQKPLEQILQEQELEKQSIIKRFEEQQQTLQQQLDQHDKKCQIQIRNFIQAKEFGSPNSKLDRPNEIKEECFNSNPNTTPTGKPTASIDIRMKLKETLINKKKIIESNGGQIGTVSGQAPGLNWAKLRQNDDLFQLRKTASEPNLKLKGNLKQKIIKGKASPLLKRQAQFRKRMPMHLVQTNESNTHSAPVSASSSMESNTPPNSKPESIPGSPPAFMCCGSITTGNSASSTPQYNEPSSNIQSSPFNENLFSSPSLPNISKNPSGRFYPSTTSPTLFHHQKMKKHFREKLSREVVNANLLGSIVSNQTFINNEPFLNSHFIRQKPATGSHLLSNNSVDGSINQNRDSPPSSSTVQSFRKTEQTYTPYQIGFKPLSKKLSRTQSAPLPFGIQLQNSLALAQQLNAANNNQIAMSQTTTSPSSTKTQSMDTNQVKQKVKQSILTKQHQQQQKLISKKPSSLDEQSSDKLISNDKNVDSGSGSFDENYNYNLNELGANKIEQELAFANLQRKLLEKIQNIDQLATSASLDQANVLNSSQFSNQQQPSSEDLNPYQCLSLAHHLMLQQQSANITQLNNQLNNNITQFFQTPLSDNYAKLLINNLQQQNALKRADRALSSPMVSHSNLYSTNSTFFNPSTTAYLAGQPSLTSLVAPFSGLNLSQTNLNTIVNLNSANASTTLTDPHSDLGNENRTAIVTDESCLAHDCTCGNPRNHLESSERLIQIIKRLYSTNLMSQCIQLPARKATIEELETVHSSTYCQFFATEPQIRQKLESSIQLNELPIKSYVRMSCGGVGIDNDTIWNELFTWQAVRAAAGCVTDLASLVAKNKLKNGFAIVRPPGHHAEHQQPMGFCYFNSVAIAAKQLKIKYNLTRILILDFDVHHGNGTQKTFYDDEQVLYISLHRHDHASFFPGTGDASETGAGGLSLGKTVNISWSESTTNYYGDAEYLSAFRNVVMPVVEEFMPEMILVSCGFDGAEGHPLQLGGYNLSPAMFGWMVNELVKLNNGRKIVLALEGGYHIPSVCDSAEQVVKALLGLPLDDISNKEMARRPNQAAVETLQKVIKIQSPYWKSLEKPNHYLIKCSHFEALTHSTKDKPAYTARRFSPITCKEEDEMMET